MDESNDVKRIVKRAGAAYYFSHETIKNYEKGLIVWEDSAGNKLAPNYFGAGLHGMNGTLKPINTEE